MFSYVQQFTGALPAGGTTLTSATELAYMTSPASLSVPPPDIGVVIRGYVNATAGATGTAFTIKCRRGSGTGGTQVGVSNTHTVANNANASIPFAFVDPTPVAPFAPSSVYTVTVTAVGANGTAVDGQLEVCVPATGGTDT